jgi:hypothetical protein
MKKVVNVLAVGHGSDLPHDGTRLCAVRCADGSWRLPTGLWADAMLAFDVASAVRVCSVIEATRRWPHLLGQFQGLKPGEWVLDVMLHVV